MPELPEVETVRRGLQPCMEGAQIESLELRRPNLRFPFPSDMKQKLSGRHIEGLSRRAKYLLAHIDNGSVVIMHLGMSGSFRIDCDQVQDIAEDRHYQVAKNARHDHVVFNLRTLTGKVARVTYNDPRRFGFMLLCDKDKLTTHPMIANLGVEPTGNRLDGNLLANLMKGRKTSLKAALLDQKLVAGLGNIYVCEALWRAQTNPRREAASLTRRSKQARNRADLLATSIRDVIAEAIEAGGSTLRDHRLTDGSLGYFQHSFSAYDREGESCMRSSCNGTIQRFVQNGRSTFWCPECQN